MTFATPPSLSDEDFATLQDFVATFCGIHFSQDSRFLLEKRVHQRLEVNEMRRVAEYLSFLRWDPGGKTELGHLIDSLTTNETYFFREDYQLKAFTDEIVPAIVESGGPRGDRTLRVWSAGCSSGEEPYTIGILLAERPPPPGWKVEIYAADINQTVLAKARTGVYRRSSFRVMEPGLRDRYFEQDGEQHRLRDDIRTAITFMQINLLDPRLPELLPKIDVLFCRNVLMYFHLEAKRKVIEHFYEVLDEGGYLLLGHSESLSAVSPLFRLVHLKNDMVYRKPLP